MTATGWLWLIAGYGGWVLCCSVVMAGLVAWDKRCARRGGWRVAERTLHGWELAGGWPGGWWARKRFGHKTRKRGYVVWARCMVGLHVLAVLGLVGVLVAFVGK